MFWVHANTRVRFEEEYKTIADKLGLARPATSQADVPQLVKNWLCEETNNRWIMVMNNADDATIFKSKIQEAVENTGSQSTVFPSLENFIP